MEYLTGIWLTQLTWMADHPTLVIPVFVVVGLLTLVLHQAVSR